MKSRLLYFTAITVLALTGILIVTAFWMLFIPRDIVHINRQPYRILTPVVHAGGRVVYEADICKYIDAKSTTTRSFVGPGGIYITVAPLTTNLPPACRKNPVAVAVPLNVDPGRYHLSIGLSYDVNAIRKNVTYQAQTEEFTVVK